MNSSNFEEKLNNILQGQIGIKLLLNRVLSKLENNSFEKNNQQSIQLDKTFLSNFPIDNAERFMSIENLILNENGFATKLVAIYIKIKITSICKTLIIILGIFYQIDWRK